MLILAKTALSMMLGFIFAIIVGLIGIPILKKVNFRQHVSDMVGERHLKKEGTPTMGGFIFILPVIFTLFLLYIRGSITLNYNLIIVVFVFLSYAALGFVDDFLKVRFHNNTGLRISTKFLLQMCIAL
ncbi:MAG: phospho-N-acetylmuramoyl-pentapeptide-transferase, partial [Bacilli bacterium]|nr:phospho-N-acetylmuramoyl-pentapeptide-transferase [Bacilli bacterium]